MIDRRMFARAALGAIVLNEAFGNAGNCLADDKTVSAKVVSVDADKATIAVGDATYNVHSSAQIKVNGKRGKLRDVEPGMVVTLTFNSPRAPVRVVNKIEATGSREEPGTGDLPKGPVQTAPDGEGLPWLKKAFIQRSPDTVAHFCWTSQETPTSESIMWMTAGYDENTKRYLKPQPLFPAIECMSDGDNQIVIYNGGPLLVVGRVTPDAQWSRPVPMTDLKKHGHLRSPRFARWWEGRGGLICDRVDGTTIQPVFFPAQDRDHPSGQRWAMDSPIEIKVPANFEGRLRNFYSLPHGKALACLQDQRTPGPTVFLLSGGNGKTSFTECDPVLPADPRGGDIRGFSPSSHPADPTTLFLTGLGNAAAGCAAFIFKAKVQELSRL